MNEFKVGQMVRRKEKDLGLGSWNILNRSTKPFKIIKVLQAGVGIIISPRGEEISICPEYMDEASDKYDKIVERMLDHV